MNKVSPVQYFTNLIFSGAILSVLVNGIKDLDISDCISIIGLTICAVVNCICFIRHS